MSFYLTHPYLISFLFTFVLSHLITRAMILINISDVPKSRSAHDMPTPRAGGVAVVVSFFGGASLLFYLYPPSHGFSWDVLGLVAGASLIGAGVSFLDDIGHVPYRLRLLVQACIAMALVAAGLKIHCPALEGLLILPFVEFFLTLLFIIFVTNAANFVDGLNGLLSGSVLLALPFMLATTILMPSSFSSDYWTYLICVVLFGAILGFYLYNFPKGRIFLGDVGSVFIGLMVGIIALMGQKSHPEQPTWLFINARLFLLIYPLGFIWFDPVFTVIRRLSLGRSMFEPNRDFLLHLLNRSGYTHSQVSGLYYLSVVLLGSMALITPMGYMPFLGLVFGYVLLQSLFVIWVFSQARRSGVTV
ncbi:MAG: undecaprenyl/decaprenyl-phosphate alpha-N-acetylglucosaminyl 1-phosphate transferase [Alphaproteobacteria bacterium]|jgi:UDP-GlcNAc:undecaprenyl-phosphate GlcNAc-1-phosphate transferase|nr:undecaprenyl/decaprenyl-phosphate alpha-N-acetylglucosaminyl 1-phosphate transferase [Alphaproteobacteria bacterium]